jgi:hypothetical protein
MTTLTDRACLAGIRHVFLNVRLSKFYRSFDANTHVVTMSSFLADLKRGR